MKVLFIDWFKTLSSSHFFEAENISEDISSVLQRELFQKSIDLLEPWMRGLLNYNYIIDHISSSISLSKEVVLKAFNDSCSSMKFDSPLFIGLIQKISATGIDIRRY